MLSKFGNANFVLMLKKARNRVAYFFETKKAREDEVIALKARIRLLEMHQNRTNDYLENIVNIIPANIYWMDTNCVILGSNLSHTQQAGFSSPPEVIGKTDRDFVWKHAADTLIENDRKVMETGIGLQIEETGLLTDGTSHTFLTNKVPMRDKNNQIIGVAGISTDITEFKALQTELAKARDAAFAANAKAIAEEEMRKTVMVLVGDIVHDLRTPITTIKAVADLMDAVLPVLLQITQEAKSSGVESVNLLSEDKWNYLLQNTPVTAIKNAVELMDDFISTTLAELAKAHKALATELTKDELNKCSIRRIISKTLDVYPFADSERASMQQDIASDFYLLGNSILIMKILFNVIKNASEQIELNGSGFITISTKRSQDYNLVIIKDTGGGATPEITANMFNDYFTTKKNGTGIGLAFCKRTMMSFGGDIVAHSVYGESMELILKFPVLD